MITPSQWALAFYFARRAETCRRRGLDDLADSFDDSSRALEDARLT